MTALFADTAREDAAFDMMLVMLLGFFVAGFSNLGANVLLFGNDPVSVADRRDVTGWIGGTQQTLRFTVPSANIMIWL